MADIPAARHLAAIDLGASSGRVIDAQLADGRLELVEVHRFENKAVHVPDEHGGRWCWDTIALWDEVRKGLGLMARRVGRIDAVGIDTWGVDYGLLDKAGRLVQPPVAYRDPRNDAAMQRVHAQLGAERIYAKTGIQFMPFNTLYQLAADAADPARPLERAEVMLMTPQLLSYWLTGHRVGEHTMASTSQAYDTQTRAWINELTDPLSIPDRILPDIVPDGHVIGPIRAELADELGLTGQVPVIAVGSHDTASAVVGTPLSTDRSAYLSSGTWSLLGVELDQPCRTDAARVANLTNEAGVGGKIRCLRNIAGLWLLQECRRLWVEAGHRYEYAELVELAEKAPAFAALVPPDDPRFAKPGDMPARLREVAAEHGQSLPDNTPDDPEAVGAIVRCVLESLALRYAQTIRDLADITGLTADNLHIVGGGSNNALLNRFAADATGLTVTAGPGEATAVGNALVQAIALGDLADLAQARQVVRDSFATQTIEPRSDQRDAWQAALARLDAMTAA